MKKLVFQSLLTIAGTSLLILPVAPFKAIAAQNSTQPRIDRYLQNSPSGLALATSEQRSYARLGLFSKTLIARQFPDGGGGKAKRKRCRETEWTKYGDYITSEISPWFNSVRGIDFSRQIQFRVGSGIYATRTTATCLVQRTRFTIASAYRVTQCARPGACRVTPWLRYGRNLKSPGFRFPGKNVGYDPYAYIYHRWDSLSPIPNPPLRR